MHSEKDSLPIQRSSKGRIHLLSTARHPVLEIADADGRVRQVPFMVQGKGRQPHEKSWVAEPALPVNRFWKFRIRLNAHHWVSPQHTDFFETTLHSCWVQDGAIYDYFPAAHVSPSRVVKVDAFEGSLPQRPLYIYLPRGYDEHPDRSYPVIYMHDGQNCFEAFVEDSYAGSWQADVIADRLICLGQMRECIIVGVGNGSEERIAEYLPPYATYQLPPRKKKGSTKTADAEEDVLVQPLPIVGRAQETAVYYRDDVAGYLGQHYRVDSRREQTATCGSSMGGLFSTYLAWEVTGFARHHAILSPAYWLTKTADGVYETIERLRTGEPRDVRLWLDSGTEDAPGRGDDGWPETAAARDALLENGYQIGPNFQFYRDEGACHRESDWAARLPQVFGFLFPF